MSVDLWIPQAGERWALLGRNASGKTTLLKRMAIGFAGCAYMPQHHRDSFALPVRDWLLLHANESQNALDDPINALLVRIAMDLDIAHLLDRRITEISGGERQRVGVAAVAIQRKAIWLLDEPISAQDPAHQALIGHWLIAQKDVAIVFAAHDVPWVGLTATHVFAFFESGSQAQGTAAQMLTSEKLEAIFGCVIAAPAINA